jgi:hypothetical protein
VRMEISLFLWKIFLRSLVFLFLDLASSMPKFFVTAGLVTQTQYVDYLHPLLGTDEVTGDIMVDSQCHASCCWRSLDMCMINSVVETAH